MKRFLRITISGLLILYGIICAGFYLAQDKLLFHPRAHPAEYQPQQEIGYDEHYFSMEDGVRLHGLLIPTDSSKGLVFYLHGNAGSIWERLDQSNPFVEAGYDFFMPDYRGFGKSGGSISSEDELYSDMLAVFDSVKSDYTDRPIVIYGYSLGSGIATRIAAENDVDRVLLLAPYYSIVEVKNSLYPFIPSFLVRYPLRSNEDYARISAPVTIFHGLEDNLIPVEHSMKLAEINPPDSLILLDGQEHNGIPWHEAFLNYIRKEL